MREDIWFAQREPDLYGATRLIAMDQRETPNADFGGAIEAGALAREVDRLHRGQNIPLR